MIVSKDIHPERDVYYLGAKIIDIVDRTKGKDVNFLDTFQKLNKKEKVSIGLYTLALDWLFLMGAIKRTDKGNLVKCF